MKGKTKRNGTLWSRESYIRALHAKISYKTSLKAQYFVHCGWVEITSPVKYIDYIGFLTKVQRSFVSEPFKKYIYTVAVTKVY